MDISSGSVGLGASESLIHRRRANPISPPAAPPPWPPSGSMTVAGPSRTNIRKSFRIIRWSFFPIMRFRPHRLLSRPENRRASCSSRQKVNKLEWNRRNKRALYPLPFEISNFKSAIPGLLCAFSLFFHTFVSDDPAPAEPNVCSSGEPSFISRLQRSRMFVARVSDLPTCGRPLHSSSSTRRTRPLDNHINLDYPC